MAYTFDRINNLFGRPEKDKSTNVFDQQSQTKTTFGGDVSSGDTGSATNAGGESAIPKSMSAPSGAAIKRNVMKAQTPQATQRIGQDLQTAQENLQNEANQYVQGYQERNYGVADSDVDKAVTGDADSFQKLANRYQTKAFGAVDQFAPKTDYNVEDAQLLGSEGGIKRLMAREAGDRYSAGEGAFDVGLLRRNTDFNLIADQLQRRQKALSEQGNKLREDKTKESQQIADTKYAESTKALEDALRARESQTLTEAEKAAQEVNQRRQALRSGGDQEFINQNKQIAMQEALKDIMAYNPRARRFYDELSGSVDPSQFYEVGGDVGYQDVLSEDQASKFNRIQDILGTGRSLQASRGPGEDQRFNVSGLQDYLTNESMEKRGQEDKKLDALIKNIQQAGKSRASQINIAKEQEDRAAFDDAFNRIMEKLSGEDISSAFAAPEGQASLYGRDLEDRLFREQVKNEDRARLQAAKDKILAERSFAEQRPTIYDEQVYTDDEVAQMNAAFDDLGYMGPRAQKAIARDPAKIKEQELMQRMIDYRNQGRYDNAIASREKRKEEIANQAARDKAKKEAEARAKKERDTGGAYRRK